MTKDEALKLALEFIENSECGTADLEARIKKALAQEQEPVALHCCGYADASAIKWNPHNQVVQCHNCGQIYTATPQPQPEPTNIARHEANVQKFLGAPQPKEWESVDGYFLPISALNEPMKIGIEKLIAHAKQARWTNAIVRKDSVETSYEADWIKSLVKHTIPPQRKPLPPQSPCEMTQAEGKMFKLGWLECEAAHGIKE